MQEEEEEIYFRVKVHRKHAFFINYVSILRKPNVNCARKSWDTKKESKDYPVLRYQGKKYEDQ